MLWLVFNYISGTLHLDVFFPEAADSFSASAQGKLKILGKKLSTNDSLALVYKYVNSFASHVEI